MRHVSRHIVSFLFLSCVWLLTISCSSKYPILEKLAPLPEEGVCRVAVLPFENQTDFRDGDILFYRVFASELAKLGNFTLVHEGDIRDAFRQVRVIPGSQDLSFDQMRMIGDYLKAEIMIIGSITKMSEVPSRNVKNELVPFLTVNLRLFDVASGRTLWSIYHTRDGGEYRKVMHFGLISTTTRLADQVSKEIVARWISEGFIGKCTE